MTRDFVIRGPSFGATNWWAHAIALLRVPVFGSLAVLWLVALALAGRIVIPFQRSLTIADIYALALALFSIVEPWQWIFAVITISFVLSYPMKNSWLIPRIVKHIDEQLILAAHHWNGELIESPRQSVSNESPGVRYGSHYLEVSWGVDVQGNVGLLRAIIAEGYLEDAYPSDLMCC